MTAELTSMITSITVGLLSFSGTLAGAYISNKKSQALIAYRLEQLEKKVDVHNHVIERVYNLEERQAVTEEKIKVANHRIDDIEHMEKNRGNDAK